MLTEYGFLEHPNFKHDCERCVFIGNYSDERYPKADLYWCLSLNGQTVIVRYGDDGPEYSSGMIFADRGMNLALVEAKRRADVKGLLIKDTP